MRKYLALAKLAWAEVMEYRTNFILEMTGTVVLMIFTILLWQVIFQGRDGASIGGFTLSEMITYLIGATVLAIFIFRKSQGDTIDNYINRGELSKLLTKPLSVPLYWFIDDGSRRFLQLIMAALILLILPWFFSDFFSLPSSLPNLGILFVFLLAASILHYLLFSIFGLLAFWLEQTWGERFVLNVIADIAAGLFIPLSLFPPFWQSVFGALPFKFMIFIPLQGILGKLSSNELLSNFYQLFIWLTVLLLINRFLWRKGLKIYEAAGN